MARTKRSVSSAESDPITPESTKRQRQPLSRLSANASARQAPAPDQDAELHLIDERVPVPDTETIPVDIDRDVLTLSEPCFPDVFNDDRLDQFAMPGIADLNSLFLEPDKPCQPEALHEYPESAVPGPGASDQEDYTSQTALYNAAVANGVIPATDADAVLVYEQVVYTPILLPLPSSFDPFVHRPSGEYVGFRRAVVAEFTQVLIQPIMTAQRPATKETQTYRARWDPTTWSYVYKDHDTYEPVYEPIQYKSDIVVGTSAAFHAISLSHFKSKVDADPYQERLKLADKSRRVYPDNNKRRPIPLKNKSITGLTVWVVPDTAGVDQETTTDGQSDHEPTSQFTLEHKDSAGIFRDGIRPEMMPYVRVVVRPMRGFTYGPEYNHYPYRWSLYLRMGEINAALRSGSAAQVSVIRDLLAVVGRQVGWIADHDADEALQGMEFTKPANVADLCVPRSIPNGLLSKLDLSSLRLVAWLHHREMPAHQSIPISLSPLRLFQTLVRLGPDGMYFEPMTDRFYLMPPDHVMQPLPPDTVTCTDSVVKPVSFATKQMILSVLALVSSSLDQQPPSKPAEAPSLGDLVPSSATLVVCTRQHIDSWIAAFKADFRTSYPTSQLVVIRNLADYAALTLEQVERATIVLVSSEFLLCDYEYALAAIAGCADNRVDWTWLWSNMHTRDYYITKPPSASFPKCRGPLAWYTRVSSHATAHDHLATQYPPNIVVHGTETVRVGGGTRLLLAPVLLHKMYWRRLVFDSGVSRSSANSSKFPRPNGTQDRVGESVNLRGPLRELHATATITILKVTSAEQCTSDVYAMLGLTPGDLPPERPLSMRAKYDLLKQITFEWQPHQEKERTRRPRPLIPRPRPTELKDRTFKDRDSSSCDVS